MTDHIYILTDADLNDQFPSLTEDQRHSAIKAISDALNTQFAAVCEDLRWDFGQENLANA